MTFTKWTAVVSIFAILCSCKPTTSITEPDVKVEELPDVKKIQVSPDLDRYEGYRFMTDEFFGVYLIYADRWGLDTLAYRYIEDVDDWTREGGSYFNVDVHSDSIVISRHKNGGGFTCTSRAGYTRHYVCLVRRDSEKNATISLSAKDSSDYVTFPRRGSGSDNYRREVIERTLSESPASYFIDSLGIRFRIDGSALRERLMIARTTAELSGDVLYTGKVVGMIIEEGAYEVITLRKKER